jgi:hypothetical protein
MAYDTDRILLARTLQAEAGNQGFDGMVAAGSVINNRMRQSGKPLSDIILADGQFSAWNGVTGYAGGEQGQDMNFQPGPEALEAADAILSGQIPDPTGGATHYYNSSISDPDWGEKSGGNWTRIGDHVFGKAGGFNPTASARNQQIGNDTMAALGLPNNPPQGGYGRTPSYHDYGTPNAPQGGPRGYGNALERMPPPQLRNVLMDPADFMAPVGTNALTRGMQKYGRA